MTADDLCEVLGPFADPATDLKISDTSSSIRITITRDGDRRTYVMDKPSKRIVARGTVERTFESVESLAASPDFADLRGMAATQKRLLTNSFDAPFLEPELRMTGGEGLVGIPAFVSALASSHRDATRVVLLDGPAGVGKTHLLERITAQRASEYLRGTGRPILYVGSRGRRLSNLSDALAGATQTLRTKFTFEHVALLVRLGLLDLAVDGFDELVDADGYQDAWYALKEFIRQLNGNGVCVLAGRDTFFDQQGFLGRLQAKEGTIDLVQAHLGPVTVAKARRWLQDQGWPTEDVLAAEAEELLQPDSYVLRPYFLSQLAEGSGSGWEELADAGSPRAFLVSKFIGREAGLVSGSVSISDGDARVGVANMLQEAALDMVERESTEVDVEYLALLCDVAFSSVLKPEDVRKLQHKAGSMGLLEKTSSPRLRRFPHSELQHHFVAQAILDRLADGSMPVFLRRGVLGTDFLEILQEVAESIDGKKLKCGLNNLSRFLENEIGAERFSSNAGAILLALLVVPQADLPSELSNVQVSESVLSGTLRSGSVTNCSIFRLDARGADLTALSFRNSQVAILNGDSLTVLGASVPTIVAIQDSAAGSIIREPGAVRSWIASHQRISKESGPDAVLPFEAFFDRICRRAIRQFYFGQGGSDPAAELLRHTWWIDVKLILESENRLQCVTGKQMGGKAMPLIHIRSPRSLLNPEVANEEAIRIRRRVRERALAIVGVDA